MRLFAKGCPPPAHLQHVETTLSSGGGIQVDFERASAYRAERLVQAIHPSTSFDQIRGMRCVMRRWRLRKPQSSWVLQGRHRTPKQTLRRPLGRCQKLVLGMGRCQNSSSGQRLPRNLTCEAGPSPAVDTLTAPTRRARSARVSGAIADATVSNSRGVGARRRSPARARPYRDPQRDPILPLVVAQSPDCGP